MLDVGNQSSVTTFILLGFSEYPHLHALLFLLFFIIYTVTLIGNLGIIVVRRINPKLHTPMYFFLSHLSFLDVCYSSVFTPKLLEILIVEDRTISFKGCMTQFFFICAFVITEMFMLAVMAYDRFVAVCNPLLYTVVMSPKLCALLVAGTYMWGVFCSSMITYSLLQLSYCGPNIINHFGCDLPPLLSLACSDVTKNELFLFIIVNFNEILTIVIIFISYLLILVTILKMRSAEGRRKAFSTCASHLTVIIVFHGTILFIYCQPSSGNSVDVDKVTTVFYTVVIPLLNPLIYSLRNKDVKEALRKVLGSKKNSLLEFLFHKA
ncbi:Olfactory receptor 1165 [Lemmus lemmus]